MLANMACSLIEHKRINTTLAKAKALRKYVEPLVTKSKDDTTHSRRVVFSYLKQKDAVTELFKDISAKVADRPGGYTRIIKTGNRHGDNAEMCMIELVDYNETYTAGEVKKKKSRRGSKKKTDATGVAGAVADKAAAAATKAKEATKKVADKAEEAADDLAGGKTDADEEAADSTEDPKA